jgi:hypothetical protein
VPQPGYPVGTAQVAIGALRPPAGDPLQDALRDGTSCDEGRAELGSDRQAELFGPSREHYGGAFLGQAPSRCGCDEGGRASHDHDAPLDPGARPLTSVTP